MDNLKANSIKIPLNHESEEETNCNSDNTNSVDARQVPKTVHQFYFVKFLSCEDQTHKYRIEELKKLVTYIDQERLEMHRRVEEKRIEKYNERSRLERRVSREIIMRSNLVWQKRKLDLLQQALSKPSFANNACRERAIRSCSLEEETTFQAKMKKKNLHFHLLHGAKNLAKEKQILRENKNGSQQKGVIDSKLSVEEPIDLFWQLYWDGWQWPKKEQVWIMQLYEEVKQLNWTKEKSLANAAVKAMIWNCMGSKQAIQEKINLLEKESEELRRKYLALKPKIKNAARNLEKINKKFSSLERQLAATDQRRCEANKCIHDMLRQQYYDDNTI